MPYTKTNSLIAIKDFIDLKFYLNSIKKDISDQNNGLIPLNVLDYYIVYLLGLDSSGTHKSKILQYCFDVKEDVQTKYFVLPASYFEMKTNITKVKSQLNSITYRHIEDLKRDTRAKAFSSSMEVYKKNPGDFHLYRSVLIAFREAFLNRDTGRIKRAVNNVLRFFYAENLFIKPFDEMFKILSDKNIMRASAIKKIAGIANFGYDQSIYQRAFLALRSFRVRWHSDIVDSLCYAMCLNLRKSLPDYNLRFITSDAPFISFYNNLQIHQKNDCIVRNANMMAIEKYILEVNNLDMVNSLEYIDEWISTLETICDELSDYRSVKNTKLRTKVREEFRYNLNMSIENKVRNKNSDIFLETIFGGDSTGPIFDIRSEIPLILESFQNAFKMLDSHFQYGQFSDKKEQIKIGFDKLFNLFNKLINDQKFLKEQIDDAKKTVDIYSQKKWDFDIDDIIPSFRDRLETCLQYPEELPDQNLLKEIDEGLNIPRAKNIIKDIICEYYQKSKDQDKLDMAVVLQQIITDKKISCR